jgi:hypothetical protein
MPQRRRSLTPLESELRPDHRATAPKPDRLARLRRRRERRPPTTFTGAVARGLLRLGIAVGAASGIALLLSHFTGRGAAFGFYVVGAGVLAVAFLTSATNVNTPYYYRVAERERRVSMSFAYMLAGGVVVLIGVAIELL